MTKYDTQGAFEKLHEDPFLPEPPEIAPDERPDGDTRSDDEVLEDEGRNAAPRKSRKGWVIAGLVVAAIGIGGAVGEGSTTSNQTAPVTESVIIEPTELVAYDGLTVQEYVDINASAGFEAAVCSFVPTLGYEEVRAIYLDADPQLGSDTFEGAVFDQSYDAYC